MSELATLARPYAEAVFKRACESGSAQEWSDNLKFLSIAMENQALAAAAGNPKVEREAFTSMLLDLCEEHVTEEGRNLVRLLIENNRLPLVSQISRLYESYRAAEEGYIEANVKSAFPLTKTVEQQLKSNLEKALDRKVNIEVEVDSTLIGGVLVRAGDKVIDASVRGQLQKLARRLYS